MVVLFKKMCHEVQLFDDNRTSESDNDNSVTNKPRIKNVRVQIDDLESLKSVNKEKHSYKNIDIADR